MRYSTPKLARSLLALLLTLTTWVKADSSETNPTPYAFERSEQRLMKAGNGTEYRIMISWPEGKPPDNGFPVTYVLDGDDLFPVITSVLRLQAGTAKASLHNAIKPGIVVGVGYAGPSSRAIDYTPAALIAAPETYRNGKPYPPQENGGAEAFFNFLDKELKPAIEKDFRVDRSRQSLFGNGYGGLFALHVLFTRPEAFQTYIASSPSVWWNGRYILQEEERFRKRVEETGTKATLLITVGELEQSLTRHEYSWPEGPREEHLLKVSRRRMLDNTREMYWRLQNLEPKGLNLSYRVFADESHKSVVPMAISHALPFIFPPDQR